MICKIQKLKIFLFWEFLFLLIGVVVFFCTAEKSVLAEQENMQKKELRTYEIEFVIDVSGSMLQNEVGITTLELLIETIELLENINTKVGIIGYNYTISYQYSLTPLIHKEEKEISFLNTSTKQIQQIEKMILGKFGKNIVKLEGVFEDPEGDFLTYNLYQLEEGLLWNI